MANPNPTAARQAKRRKRAKRPGDIQALRSKLWDLCDRLHGEVESGEGVPDDKLKHVHALIQLSGVYLKCIEIGELNARLEALEAAQEKFQEARYR